MRARRWDLPEEPLPKRPYRNTAIFHGALAGMIVVVAWLTGGGIARAFAVAAGFFVLATAWSWTQWRRRMVAEERRRAARGAGRR